MINQASLRQSVEFLNKRKIEPRVTLVEETNSKNFSFVWAGWEGTAATNFANKIGYVVPIAAGGLIGIATVNGNAYVSDRGIRVNGTDEKTVIKELRKEIKKQNDFLAKFNDFEFALEYSIKNHDVYYDYSDDHRVWAAGNAALNRIKALCDILGTTPSEAFKKYAK